MKRARVWPRCRQCGGEMRSVRARFAHLGGHAIAEMFALGTIIVNHIADDDQGAVFHVRGRDSAGAMVSRHVSVDKTGAVHVRPDRGAIRGKPADRGPDG